MTPSAYRHDVGLVIRATFGNRDDVIANLRHEDLALTTNGLLTEQSQAQGLEFPSADPVGVPAVLC